MAGRKSSIGGLQIKITLVCFILGITAGIGAYTMPFKYNDPDSVMQVLAKRSAAVLNRYILQTFRRRDNGQGTELGMTSSGFVDTPLISDDFNDKLLPVIPPDNGVKTPLTPYVI